MNKLIENDVLIFWQEESEVAVIPENVVEIGAECFRNNDNIKKLFLILDVQKSILVPSLVAQTWRKLFFQKIQKLNLYKKKPLTDVIN